MNIYLQSGLIHRICGRKFQNLLLQKSTPYCVLPIRKGFIWAKIKGISENITNKKGGNKTMRLKIQRALASLLAILLLTCPAYALKFPDVDENAEYAEAVDYLSDIGIFSGDDKGNFNPNKTVSRAEMATIICRMLGETENLPNSTAFTDVPVGHWANAYVGKAAELGIVSGYGDGKFGPSDNVIYEQAITMIIRVIGEAEEAAAQGGYPDGFLAVAQKNDLLNGLSVQKGDMLSRAEVALILVNYFNHNE